MMTLFFTEREVKYYDDAVSSDTKLFANYFQEMLIQGIYLPPAQFEAFFISTAHSDDDINKTIEVQREVFRKILT
jgi:glutamate-1-semialdehyde 2,1-aminomutase